MAANTGLGGRVRDARLARRMSRGDFARLIGVTSTAVWNWETRGIHPRPSILPVIAKVLGVSESYLETGKDGDPTPRQRNYSEIISHAQYEIARLNGVPPSRIKITVEIMPA